jgi:hypothetical protein
VIEHPKAFAKPHDRVVSSKCLVGNGVEGASRDALYVSARTKCSHSAQYLASRTSSEREQQDAFGLNTLVEQVLDPRGQRRGLARSGSGDDP